VDTFKERLAGLERIRSESEEALGTSLAAARERLQEVQQVGEE
jgi:hypothetical protein